jgi:hypothetical protein
MGGLLLPFLKTTSRKVVLDCFDIQFNMSIKILIFSSFCSLFKISFCHVLKITFKAH